MLNPTDLEILASTVLQILVDAEGLPVSLTLLRASGHVPADELALSLAAGFQFEPLQMELALPARMAGSMLGLSWGQIVFEWQTSSPTNTPTASP